MGEKADSGTASPIWVFNTSPLINLGKIQRLNLIREMEIEAVIPAGVAEEIYSGPQADRAKFWLANEGQTLIKAAPAMDPRVVSWALGRGESEVLSFALIHAGGPRACEAVVDDLPARKCARTTGLAYRGTLGVLLLGKKRGQISRLKPLVDELIHSGAFMSDAVTRTALELADES